MIFNIKEYDVNFLIPVGFVILIIAIIAYMLKRDSAVDDGKEPLSVGVPVPKPLRRLLGGIAFYTLTPSRWFWGKVRENKRAVAIFIVVAVFAVWWLL